MLDKDHRFHGLNSLSFAYKRGQVVRASTAALKYVLNKRRTTFRAAVVVSRKVDKSAVVRNRIRRRLYEAIGQHKITEPYDLVFTVFSSQLATAEPSEITKLVTDLLRRAGVAGGQHKPAHGIVKPIKTEGNT
jgi:ribonuclease P protein component